MRIAQIVQKMAPGGLEVMVLELAKQYQENDEIFIVSLDSIPETLRSNWPRLNDDLAASGIELVALNKPSGLSLPTLISMWKLLRQRRPDIVHTHHIGPLLYGGIAARLCSSIKVVHSEHDIWHLAGTKARLLQRMLLKLVRPLHVAITNEMADFLRQAFGGKVHVIPNGINTDVFVSVADSMMKKNRSKRIIGAVGRLEPVKGMDLLIDAFVNFQSSNNDNDDYQLRIAGDGSQYQALATKIAALEHSGLIKVGQIELLGQVENIAEFLGSLNCFVQPSRAEGLPLAPLEALSCNVPTIITPVAGAAELAAAGAIIVDSAEASAISKGLALVFGGAFRHVETRENVARNFSIQNVAKKYRALYNEGGI